MNHLFLSPESTYSAKPSPSHCAREFKVVALRETAPATLADTPEHIYTYWQQSIPSSPWFDPCKEWTIVIMLNTRRKLIGHAIVASGTLDTCLLHPREVFRPAIAAASSAIIIAHNHPSGDPTPSADDIRATRDLIKSGRILKLELLDHIIIGSPGGAPDPSTPYVSLRSLGYFYS
jgi:DNA repair protein RadC